MTIRQMYQLNCAIISFIMGFTAPIVSPYFMGELSSQQELIGFVIMLSTGIQFAMSIIKASEVSINFFLKHYGKIAIANEIGFIINATISDSFPFYGFLVYNILMLTFVDILNLLRSDTLNQIVAKFDFNKSIFDSQMNSIKVLCVFLGTLVSTTIATYIQIPINIALLLEAILCGIGHFLQIKANKKLRKEVLKEDEYPVTIKEFILDLIKRIISIAELIKSKMTTKKKVNLIKHKKDVLDQ